MAHPVIAGRRFPLAQSFEGLGYLCCRHGGEALLTDVERSKQLQISNIAHILQIELCNNPFSDLIG